MRPIFIIRLSAFRSMIEELDLTNADHLKRLKEFSMLEHPPSFRYFKNRVFEDAVKTHKITMLYSTEDKKDVAYAHIDVDGSTERPFFGICVLREYQSKGIGKLLTNHILQRFFETVYLTVDNDNLNAISLYKKFGFKQVEYYPTSALWRRMAATSQ
jgi:GNAT superfamily N-acetyltransferase